MDLIFEMAVIHLLIRHRSGIAHPEGGLFKENKGFFHILKKQTEINKYLSQHFHSSNKQSSSKKTVGNVRVTKVHKPVLTAFKRCNIFSSKF